LSIHKPTVIDGLTTDQAKAVLIPTGLRTLYTKSGHAFVRGNAVRGTDVNTIVLAQANTNANAAVTGMVDKITTGGGIGGIDANCVLCSHLNSDFSDSSARNHAPTVIGDFATISTSVKVFGAGAASLNSGSYFSYADSADWDFGTGDFTFECRFRKAGGADQPLFSRGTSGAGGDCWFLQIDGNGFAFSVRRSNTWLVDVYRTFSPTQNVWYHLAFVRSGTALKFYVDGSQLGTDAAIGASDSLSIAGDLPLTIGNRVYDGYTCYGFLDEIRVSNTARWIGPSFTVPTSEYTAGSGETFEVCFGGFSDSGVTDFTAGEYYLDQSTPGLLTTTRPGSGIVRHVASCGANGTPPIIQIYGEVP